MNERIKKAYINTRTFVNFIEKTLPEAKINFVSEELAKRALRLLCFHWTSLLRVIQMRKENCIKGT